MTQRKLHILFVMRRLKYLPYFRTVLEEILDRGHALELLLSDADHSPREQEWLAAMSERPNFSHVIENHFAGDPLRRPAIKVRRGSEAVRGFVDEFAEREIRHQRETIGGAPEWIRYLDRHGLLRLRRVRRAVAALMLGIDRVMPLPSRAARFVEASGADVVAICDHGRPGSLFSEYVRAAREAGIPSALCVASWDNLSTRQITRVVPDRMLVWNDYQVREAEVLHEVPASRVVATGAPPFDEWFRREPRDAAWFKQLVGLDPARPYVLWVGGALLPAPRTEADYAAEWVAALRERGPGELRSAGVLLRPHPLRIDEWTAVDFSRFENVAVYPGPGMTMPVGADQRADYFDSIFHSAAVVGINSSAMIEAAIVGRSVITTLVPEFHDSQQGSFHFSYVLEANGGPVRIVDGVDAQFAALEDALAGRDGELREHAAQFVERFVRPRGLDRPATPIWVDELERVATLTPEPVRDNPGVVLVRALIAAWFRSKYRLTILRSAAVSRAGRAA